jgi:hypothetical protein
MNIPNNKTPKLSTEEKINFTMLYPDAKSHKEEDEDEAFRQKKKLEKARINSMKPNDRSRYLRFGSGYVTAPQYDRTNKEGGYMSASGGYMTARGKKQGGAIIAAALTAGALGIAGALGSNFGSHIYHHAAPFVERGIHKFKNFFKNKIGEGAILSQPSIMTNNTTPLMYYKQLFKDTGANLKHLGLNDDLTKYYTNTTKQKMFNNKLNKKIKMANGSQNEGGIRKHLKHRHIAMPLVFNEIAEKYKNLPPAQLRRKANTIANHIYGKIPPTKLGKNENHLKTLKKYIKDIQNDGKGIGKIPPNELNQVLNSIIKKLRNMGVTHYNKYKLKKAFNRYAKHREISLPSFKGVKEGKDILNRIDDSDLEERDKLALKTIGDILIQKRRYMGLGKIAPALLSHLNLGDRPENMLLLRKVLKDVGSAEDLRDELKKPNSKITKILVSIGVPVGVILSLIGLYLARKQIWSINRYIPEQYKTKVKAMLRKKQMTTEPEVEPSPTGEGNISPKLFKYLDMNRKLDTRTKREIYNRLGNFKTQEELKKEVTKSPWWKKIAIIAGISIPILLAGLGIVWGTMKHYYGPDENTERTIEMMKEYPEISKWFIKQFPRAFIRGENVEEPTETTMSTEQPNYKLRKKMREGFESTREVARRAYENLSEPAQRYYRNIVRRFRFIKPTTGDGMNKDLAKLSAANLAQTKSRDEMKKKLKQPMWKKVLKYLGISAGSLVALSALVYGMKKGNEYRKVKAERAFVKKSGETFEEPISRGSKAFSPIDWSSSDPLEIMDIEQKIPGKSYPSEK